MPGEHAVLSPSSAERWTSCPASVRMARQAPDDTESPYAREGTEAHTLAELKARLAFGMITPDDYDAARAAWHTNASGFFEMFGTDLDAMEGHTDAYVTIVKVLSEAHPYASVLFEQRMDTGVPECWGTADTVVIAPTVIEVVDFKYGAGVQVSPYENPQLMLYGVAALERYGDVLGDTELVRLHIHQPRLDHFLTWETTAVELRAWRDAIIPVALEALGDDARFGPSEAACRWCPASGLCPAQLEAVFSTDFDGDPKLLTPDQVSETQDKVGLIRDWLNAFEEAALHMAYSDQVPIPRYKVVASGGKRFVTDGPMVIKVLTETHGYPLDAVSKPPPPAERTVKGIGDLEKALGKDEFKVLLEDTGLVKKSEGRPSLVPESDSRPAINPNSEAQKAFSETPLEEQS